MRRFPVRRQAHHLVLVAVFLEAEILRDRQVEHAERVREEHAIEHVEPAAAPVRNRDADEVAEPIDRATGGLGEAAGAKRARQVRRMMLDESRARVDASPVKG